MDWHAAVVWGMVGGAIVEAIALWGNLTGWQKARHTARSRGVELPRLSRYLDPAADTLVALTRLILGATAALVLHAEVCGVVSAIAVGASAPALLSQLGALHLIPVAENERIADNDKTSQPVRRAK